jgi:hypothetical protein
MKKFIIKVFLLLSILLLAAVNLTPALVLAQTATPTPVYYIYASASGSGNNWNWQDIGSLTCPNGDGIGGFSVYVEGPNMADIWGGFSISFYKNQVLEHSWYNEWLFFPYTSKYYFTGWTSHPGADAWYAGLPAPQTMRQDYNHNYLADQVYFSFRGSSSYTYQVYLGCYGVGIATPTPTPTQVLMGNGRNVILDGGMEYFPTSPYWFPTPNDNRYEFGRITDNDLISFLRFGSAACQNGFHIIGTIPSPLFGFPILGYSDMRQRFTWNGGDMYFRYSIGAQDSTGVVRNVPYVVDLVNITTSEIVVLSQSETPNDWQWRETRGMVAAVQAGTYLINVKLADYHLDYDYIKIDDVYVSNEPVTDTCINTPIPATTVTATVTGTVYPTTTPTGGVPANLILNCGFDQGSWYWDFKSGAQVIYSSGNNYGHIEWTTATPGISQLFYWPGGTAYTQFSSNSNMNVYFQNVNNYLSYVVVNGLKVSPTWVTYRTPVDLPAGSYRISLHFPAGAGPGDYDNITVSLNGYYACQAGANATATLRPSSTPQASATMFPTSTPRPTYTTGPTSTTVGGQNTSTTQPTFTPYPTNTPYPTYTPYTPPPATSTPRPQPTLTPFPTYTQQPTYTLIPTYTQQPTHTQQATSTTEPGTATSTPQQTFTPWPTYTPGIPGLVGGLPSQPPPPQPPPAYYADCQRPQNGYDMANWLEYSQCMMLSYGEWSPNAQATMEAWPTLFAGYEPLGSINEAQNTLNGLMGMVKSIDTSAGGLPGTNEQPEIGAFFGTEPGPWTTGQWTFNTNTGTRPNMACNVRITGFIGQLASGFCWFFQILAEKGVMAWVQLFINIASIGFLLVYIWKKFIDAGSGAA